MSVESKSRRSNREESASEDVVQQICRAFNEFLAAITEEIREDVRSVLCLDPLPKSFDYSYSLLSYFWTVVFMTSKTVGAKFGKIAAVKSLLGVLGNPALFLLTYVLLPIYAILLHQKTPASRASTSERRLAIMGFACLLGATTEFFWSDYVQPAKAPSYYLPLVVGLAIQVAGPQMQGNRIAFIASTVGIASGVSLFIAKSVAILDFTYVLCTLISASISVVNLQLLIAVKNKTEHEMTYGHLRTVIFSIYVQMITVIFASKHENK